LDMERARRELRQLQKIDAHNLVKIIDHGKTSDGRLYVVMDPVQGQGLGDLVAVSPFTVVDAQRVIRGIGVGLSEAQKVGVIHRDIAPHNILIASDGTVKILGFGVAASIKRNVFGTPEFISPEQASGRPVDQRSNIYSLGALMFFMLTGEPPFTGSTEEVLEQHQNAEPPSPKDRRPCLDISPRATQLVAKALAKSSSRRHLTLRQFLREVESIDASNAEQVQPRGQTPSFETPLHGVTSLSGGVRPPSSEYRTLQKGSSDAVTASDVNVPAPAPTSAKRSLRPHRPSGAIDAATGSSIAGELSGGNRVSLKKTDEQPAVAKAGAEAPAKGVGGAHDQGGGKGGGKGGFRETMWFFKGEIESALAESGEAEEAPVEASADELQDKYRDDGSIDEAGKKLSLRTGNTQMMQAAKVPSGVLPGEKMGADEFISEMNSGRKIAIVLGILLAIGAVGAAVYFLVIR
ncbi:MAG: serine/threonine protein kinase, partial [Deltaproteobacteria bacterium]|nr:serine/threonine protein kinase [Deltaproteobacteria bacterium]